MRKYLCRIFIPGILVISCNEPAAKSAAITIDTAAVKKEVTAFMDQYESMARKNDYSGIAGLYDSSGAMFINIEVVEYENYDTIRNSYEKMKNDTIRYFKWQEPMIIDPLKPDVATVSTNYQLHMNRFIDTFKSRYSSVLIKTAHGWKIKQENEMPEIYTAKKLVELMEKRK